MDSDLLIIGAGVAGLRATLELVPAGHVLVVSKVRARWNRGRARREVPRAFSGDWHSGLPQKNVRRSAEGDPVTAYTSTSVGFAG